MLTLLEVAGYRSIKKLRVELDDVNVVVGANGTGKTNLYRSLYLLHAAAQGDFARTIASEGGMPSVLWAGARADKKPVRMRIGVRLDELEYELCCGLPIPVPGEGDHFKLDPEVKEEDLWFHDGSKRFSLMERRDKAAFLRDADGNRETFGPTLWRSESILSQLAEPHRFPVLSQVRQQVLAWRFYHHFRTDADAPVRQPQVGVRTPVLSHDGHDLAAALQTIRYIGDEEGLADAINHAFPGSRIEVTVDRGRLGLEMSMPGILRPLEARELSDGTLRYLCLLAALLSPRPPPLLALNEPETSLHPDLLDPLADLITVAARQSQVWVTTHAEQLASRIGKVRGARVIRLERPAGETLVVD
jgi:predicted ATPase